MSLSLSHDSLILEEETTTITANNKIMECKYLH